MVVAKCYTLERVCLSGRCTTTFSCMEQKVWEVSNLEATQGERLESNED